MSERHVDVTAASGYLDALAKAAERCREADALVEQRRLEVEDAGAAHREARDREAEATKGAHFAWKAMRELVDVKPVTAA